MTKNFDIVPFEPSLWPGIERLLRASNVLPTHISNDIPNASSENLGVSRVRGLVAGKNTSTWVARSGDGTLGGVSLTELNWDSEQLGIPAARLDFLVSGQEAESNVKGALLEASLSRSSALHVTARVDSRDLSTIHVLEQHGFITVDAILTFAKQSIPGPVELQTDSLQIRLATSGDAEAAGDLARTAFVYDRFHADPAIPSSVANKLHQDWVRNSCTGKAADAVLLACDHGRLAGFVTCKIQRDSKEMLGKSVGTIVLVATALEFRGRGVARLTTMASLAWFHSVGVDIVEVGTQLRNLPAARLYQRCGFELVGSTCSFRKFRLE
jgi:GNAT superfamily N-acetyltransferase